MSRPEIAIFGAYGGINIGDEMILSGILRMLTARGIDRTQITVGSWDPEYTQTVHRIKSVRGIRLVGISSQFIAAIRRCDAVIIGGGQLLQESALLANPWTGLLNCSATVARAAKKYGKAVFIWGVGVEHIRSSFGRKSLLGLEAAGCVTVRDKHSADILKKFGFSDVRIVGDPAFAMDDGDRILGELVMRQLGITPGGENSAGRIGICMAREPGQPMADMDVLAGFIQNMVHQGWQVVLFPSENRRIYDPAFCRRLAKAVGYKCDVVPPWQLTPEAMADLTAAMDLVVTSRMHVAIAAAMSRTAVILSCRSPKASSLVEQMALPWRYQTGQADIGKLSEWVEALKSGQYPFEIISERIVQLRQSAQNNADKFCEFVAS